MKKISFFALTALTLGLFSCNSSENTQDEVQVPENAVKVELMTESSDILWIGKKLKGGAFDHDHEGRLVFNNGYIIVADENLVSGEFEIDMTSMKKNYVEEGDEMAAKLIGHLKSDDFFDVEKFPTAKVTISKYEDGKASGTLTVKGVDIPWESDDMRFKLDGGYYTIEGRFDYDFSPFKMDGFGSEGDDEYVSPNVNIDVFMEFKAS